MKKTVNKIRALMLGTGAAFLTVFMCISNAQAYDGHWTHIDENPSDRGVWVQCLECHSMVPESFFADGKNTLEETTVCDECHSPGGAFDGVNDPVIGAKANWRNGVYTSDEATELKPGLENWCAGCHDDGSSVCEGVAAPNVMGDNSMYGYNITGHKIDCGACHDLNTRHIDGDARTYSKDSDPWNPNDSGNYQNGYRLKNNMIIPLRNGPNGGYAASRFALCFDCHDYNQVMDSTTPYATNFQDDGINRHRTHLTSGRYAWDSDWDYLRVAGDAAIDSRMSCPACHNPHGSPNPAMIRHGELISTPGTQDKVPALSFRWYKEDGYTPTIFGEESYYADMPVLGGPGGGAMEESMVCVGCHGGPNPIKYDRPYQAIAMPDTGSFTTPPLPPSVRLLDPQPGSQDIGIDRPLRFFLLSNEEDELDWSTFHISLEGDIGYGETYTAADTAVSVTGVSHRYHVTVSPDANFGNNERIRVAISIADTAGHHLTSPAWYFDTGDCSAHIWRTPNSVYSESLFWSPENTVDDNPSTGNAFSPYPDHWLIYDLGESLELNQIRLLLAPGSARLWDIYVTDNPSKWGNPVKFNWLAQPASANDLTAWESTPIGPIQGRYLVIKTTRGPLTRNTLLEVDFARGN
jgi:hypothetical protein